MWTERLYAFLIRRVLGPLLSEASNNQLHKLLDISVSQGTYKLYNVELNTDYLSARLNGIRVLSATAQSLEIQLSIVEKDPSNSSIYWRAVQLTSTTQPVYLCADIIVDGVDLTVSAGPRHTSPSSQQVPPAETESTSVVSSYIQTALASLRLSVQLNNLKVRMQQDDDWLSVYSERLAYKEDGAVKTLEITKIVVDAGDKGQSCSVLLLQGTSRVTVEVSQQQHQQDICIRLHQKLNVSVDTLSIQCIQSITQSFAVQEEVSDSTTVSEHELSQVDDEADFQTLDSILQQYQTARKLAEKHLVRGGMLLSDAASGFDAFFDANQFSLSVYSTVLRESIMQPDEHPMKTNVEFHLQEASIKIVFTPQGSLRQPDEYILLTGTDVNIHSTMSSHEASHRLGIQMIEADDSIVTAKPGGRTVEIGTLMRFSPVSRKDVDNDQPLESLSITVQTEHGTYKDTVSLEMNLGAMELCYRPCTISKLTDTLQSWMNRPPEKLEDAGVVIVESENVSKKVTAMVSCPSIEIHVPVRTQNAGWSAIYERCGYCVSHVPIVRTTSLGVLLDQFSIEVSRSDKREEAIVNFRNMIAFTNSPKETCSVFDTISERFDFLAFGSRDEVDPCIPISLTILRCKSDSSDGPAVLAFPKVLPLFHFKAREEDDDEDVRIDGVLNPSDLNVNSRKESRGTDPQSMMLPEVATSDIVISLEIPEVMGDVTAPELHILRRMVGSIEPGSNTIADQTGQPSKRVSVTLGCSFVSLALHAAKDDFIDAFSFMAIADRFKAHALLDGSCLKHARVLLHEINLYEASGVLSSYSYEVNCSHNERVRALRDRGLSQADPEAAVIPLVYRSHLFSPMSREHPSILIDVVCESSHELVQRNVYCTLYDITYRYNFDSHWHSKLLEAFQNSEQSKDAPSPDTKLNSEDESLTRVFFTISDCNSDYTTSLRLATASRTIIRIGNFHVSSNIPFPRTEVQAYTLSLDDVSVLLCNRRFPYNFENICLIQSEVFLDAGMQSLAPLGLSQNSTSDDVIRTMDLKTMITVDSLDSVVIFNSKKDSLSQDPPMLASFTIGQVAISACKDSFLCFTKTIGEAVTELTALSDEAMNVLRQITYTRATGVDSVAVEVEDTNVEAISESENDFLLDGYDWTTIDSDELAKQTMSSEEEHSAKWYDNSTGGLGSVVGPRIISHHFQLIPASDPIGDGDMGAMKYAGTLSSPKVKSRVLVHDLSLKIRLFDGYDWPESIDRGLHSFNPNSTFVIPEIVNVVSLEENEDELPEKTEDDESDAAARFMGELLAGEPPPSETFQSIPLPEERGRKLKEQSELRRLARRTEKYFQITFSGVSVRLDSLEECSEHRLASCLNLKAQDFFVAETISAVRPVKVVGEWFNEEEHPRDSKDGLIMMKAITSEDEIASDESEVALKLLPLRCRIDQRAISFARAFFHSKEEVPAHKLPPGLHNIPPPLFTSFRVHAFKLKVDYTPQKLDSKALRDGAIVELINLSPLDGMVLTLQKQEVVNELGFSAVIGILAGRWVRDICSTQLMKFVTKSRPLEPITEVSGAAVDMVVLPWEAFRYGDNIQKALRSGAKGLSKALVYEFCTLTSRAAEFVAGTVSRASMPPDAGEFFPSRPTSVPRGLVDASPHAVESIARGFQAANYKIIIVPYREFHRSGATGAARSIIKGIPIAIAAPASGAAEALSFALLGARNSIRPDIRKEEEASIRGLLGDT